MIEEWRDIPGYEGLYQVSNFGRVKRLEHWKNQKTLRQYKYYHYKKLPEKIMTLTVEPRYTRVSLRKDNVTRFLFVHRLVASAFIKNGKKLPEVNHIDCDGHNNRVDNLEWCDRKYNINYSDRTLKASIACKKKVRCIDTGIVYPSVTEAADAIGAHKSKISLVCHGIRKTTGGVRWEFA